MEFLDRHIARDLEADMPIRLLPESVRPSIRHRLLSFLEEPDFAVRATSPPACTGNGAAC